MIEIYQPGLGADSNNVQAVPLRGNRVDRFVWNGSALVFDRNLIKLRVYQNDGVPVPAGQNDGGQPARGNHDGGVLAFGPDGKLYAIVGDLGRRGQFQNLQQGPTPQTGSDDDDQFGGPEPDENHLSGVVLRLNPDGSTPADNPFFALGATMGGEVGRILQRVFAYGVRNSFGIAFDPFSGELWETEHGDDAFDEINRIPGGHNGGWLQVMGPAGRVGDFKQIEMTLPPSNNDPRGGLQQFRWPPSNLAATASEALARLFVLPGSHYRDPEYSWKFATLPVGLNFFTRKFENGLRGRLLVSSASGTGFLLAFPLSDDRMEIATADKVDDNGAKQELLESLRFAIGSGFGIVTDIEISPSGTLYLASHLSGVIYELRPRDDDDEEEEEEDEDGDEGEGFEARLTGAAEVPGPGDPDGSGRALIRISHGQRQICYQLTVSNIAAATAAHIHRGPVGVAGPVVVPLMPPANGSSSGCVAVERELGRDIKEQPAAYYVNVHNADYPAGAVRGQLVKRED